MMQGRFENEGKLVFEIELIDADGLGLFVDAMLDTGFTEFLAMNTQDLDGLGWNVIGRDELQTAQGKSFFDIYLGKIVLDGKEFEIPVFVGDEIQEFLLGLQWLKMFDLVARYRQGVLQLE